MVTFLVALFLLQGDANPQFAAFIFHTKIAIAPKSLILVAREGIEPPTRGFSVRCSTN